MRLFQFSLLSLITLVGTASVGFAQTTTTVTVPATTTTTTPVTIPATTTTTTRAVVVDRPVIVTTVPAPKETLATPPGYAYCFTVKAGWYQDVWVADHQVCQYPNSPSGTVWVEGYWTCNKYDTAEGKCTNWDWKSAHWEKTLTVY